MGCCSELSLGNQLYLSHIFAISQPPPPPPKKVNLCSYESAIIMSSARPHIQKWPSSSLLPKSPTDAEHNYAYSHLFNGSSYLPFTSNTSFSTCPARFLKRLSFFFSGLSQNLLMGLIKKGVEPLLRDQSKPHHKIIL